MGLRRINDDDVIGQAIGLLARAIIWSIMGVAAGGEAREVSIRMLVGIGSK